MLQRPTKIFWPRPHQFVTLRPHHFLFKSVCINLANISMASGKSWQGKCFWENISRYTWRRKAVAVKKDSEETERGPGPIRCGNPGAARRTCCTTTHPVGVHCQAMDCLFPVLVAALPIPCVGQHPPPVPSVSQCAASLWRAGPAILEKVDSGGSGQLGYSRLHVHPTSLAHNVWKLWHRTCASWSRWAHAGRDLVVRLRDPAGPHFCSTRAANGAAGKGRCAWTQPVGSVHGPGFGLGSRCLRGSTLLSSAVGPRLHGNVWAHRGRPPTSTLCGVAEAPPFGSTAPTNTKLCGLRWRGRRRIWRRRVGGSSVT